VMALGVVVACFHDCLQGCLATDGATATGNRAKRTVTDAQITPPDMRVARL
jgi:hypothetical protein